MSDDVKTPDGAEGRIIDEPFGEALSRRYLAYALSTITQRALPDARDGLKPVHRRLLYAMRLLRLDARGSPKKSARVVGDVIGKYHPHGDVAVYDALVRLAQDFAQRYRLIDGQGNFGNIDGDNAAAMRYTECRLTSAAELLLEGIDEDAVDLRPTYDGEEEEPVVLPAGFPNLLANGSAGIAVGMATSIPPHNVGELIDACLALLKKPASSTAELMAHVQGPDFPTGGVIVEGRDSLAETYATGRGGVRLRARWGLEEMGRGLWRVVVTEIPYTVRKADLVEELAGLVEAKKAPLLAEVRDESAEDMRLVLEPRARTVEPEVMMESLFRLSALETRFAVNMNVLTADGAPRVLGLRALLQAFLDHRREVAQRRARFRLGKIEQRLHILNALLAVFLDLDEVIRIVRFEDEPKARLIARFKLDDVQAESILNTRLRQLAKLEEMQLRGEHEKLTAERAALNTLLASEVEQWKGIAAELREVKKALADPRRSTFADAPVVDAEAAAQAHIVREPITVIVSERGWIRAVKGRVEDPSTLTFKEGDALAFLVPCETTDKLMVLSADGRAFTLPCDKLPSGRGQGEPLMLMIELPEKVEVLAVFAYQPGRKRLLASKAGYGFVVEEEELLSTRKAGKAVMSGTAALTRVIDGDQLALLGDNHKILIFPVAELPVMPRGKGVKLQSYREGGLRDALVFEAEAGATWIDASGRTRAWTEWREWSGRRGASGKVAPRGFPANRRFKPG